MKCDTCGHELQIGEWPFCEGLGNTHERPARSKGFESYYDDNLMTQINNPGDRNKALRPYWENDHIVRIEPKERPAGYFRELNDRRRARTEEQKRQARDS